MPQLTWLVTGTSSGFGEQFVHSILERGDRVIATARQAKDRLQSLEKAGAAILDLDVRATQSQLDSKVQEALAIYGGIDILVNNAAYIEGALVEELDHERLLRGFETNLFGPINLTRALLPHFREKRKGVLLFMSSIGAYGGAVGAATYSSSKGALEIVVDCLREEVSPFGIQCCLVTPGYYRTKIFAPGNIKFGVPSIPDYAEFNKGYQARVASLHENQPGDPKKATDCIVDVVRGEGEAAGKTLPNRLPVGTDAFDIMRERCSEIIRICDEWEHVSTDTKFES